MSDIVEQFILAAAAVAWLRLRAGQSISRHHWAGRRSGLTGADWGEDLIVLWPELDALLSAGRSMGGV